MSGLRTMTVVGVLAGTVAGCAPLGSLGGLGDVMGGGTSLSGEVRSVDARRGRIQVREQYDGRDRTVRVDNRTRVVYQNRQYPVSSLERGDQVVMRVEYDRNNTAWADRIEVRSSARRSDRNDRGSIYGSGRIERVDGRVQAIDTRRGYFTMTVDRNARVTVHVPRNGRRDDIRRFERLRRGDRVRAEIRSSARGGQAELVRFR